MLERQKWEKPELPQTGHSKTPADTITSDLRTRSNTLSLWRIENKEDLTKAVLALAVGRNQITRLDVMILDQVEFEEADLTIEHTPENGHTPLENFHENHYDLIDMDYQKLGVLSQLIIDNVKNPEKCIRFEKSKMIEILYDAYINQEFEFEELSNGLQQDLLKAIKRLEKTRQSQ
ncbi:hypothetical protein AAB109_11345 [Priestia megaterium]|uniref:hypothetical protein n=1 Tax=Priestia megaterium TaxID=1404 RepID=UPI002ACE0829|nr:hypothetical protein [Priestia megaterium]